MSLVSNPKRGDDVSTRQAIARLGSSKLGPTSSPKFLGVTTTNLTISGLTSNSLIYPVDGLLTSLGAATDGQIPIGDTGGIPVLATITGVANEIDITNAAGSITIGLVNPLIVAKGGSGAASFTDHSILLGSDTEPFTALGLAANGQIPIGFQNSDPVLANITGDANQVIVTNGAGTIALSTPQDLDTSADFEVGSLTTTGIVDASAGEVLVEDNDTDEPTEKDDGYIGVAIIDGDARVYFAVDGTMYYIDGTIVAAEEIVTGNPIGLLLALTYNME